MAAGESDRPGLILFDDGEGSFGPLTDLRPSFLLRSGILTTAERLAERFGPVRAVRASPHLAEVLAEGEGWKQSLPEGERFLALNGRLADPGGLEAPAPGEALLAGESIAAANLDRAEAQRLLETGVLEPRRTHAADCALLRFPWHLLDGLEGLLRADAAALERDADVRGFARLGDPHPQRMGAHPILMHRTATIAPQAVLDATNGPIVIGERATIRPLCVLVGPCAVGAGSIIVDRALIKANTVCGPHCRLGGEVGGSIITGYSNKAHDGHLGDSILGEWVNFGAGTDNSNLLNTYGEVSVRLESAGVRLRSGRTFFGAVIGDHVKCAIGTRLMTGTVLGTGAMIATTAPPPTTVRRFAWLTDEGERRYQLAKFLAVAEIVMARRGRTPGDAYRRRIETLHAAAEGS